MKVYVLVAILLVTITNAYDPEFLFENIKEICGEDERCSSGILKDVIKKAILANTPLDDEVSQVNEAGMLLEVVQYRCGGDHECAEQLLEDAYEEVISDDEDNDLDFDDNDADTGGPGWEEPMREEDYEDDNDYRFLEGEDPSSEWKSGVGDGLSSGFAGPNEGWEDEGEPETEFEMYEKGENLDPTIINSLSQDECQRNPLECAKYVEKMRREGKLHIGEITIDEDGNPVADVPKALIFEEELRIPNGGDTEI